MFQVILAFWVFWYIQTQLTLTCSKSTIKILQTINFEHFSYLFSSVSIVDFKQVNVMWKDTVEKTLSTFD